MSVICILDSDIEIDAVVAKINKFLLINTDLLKHLQTIDRSYDLKDGFNRLNQLQLSEIETTNVKALVQSNVIKYIRSLVETIGTEDKISFEIQENGGGEYTRKFLLSGIDVNLDFYDLPQESHQTVSKYVVLLLKFGESILGSFIELDKEEFEEKYGMDWENFDVDKLNFNIKKVTDTFSSMAKNAGDGIDTSPLEHTVSTVLTGLLDIPEDRNLTLSDLKALDLNRDTLVSRIEKINKDFDSSGMTNDVLMNTVKQLSAGMIKSNKGNKKMNKFFKKISKMNDLSEINQSELSEIMSSNPLLSQLMNEKK